jgi:hypothetical protein
VKLLCLSPETLTSAFRSYKGAMSAGAANQGVCFSWFAAGHCLAGMEFSGFSGWEKGWYSNS